ncbi:MAG: isoleucine--tRNA ligase [Candidatus Diapherotrites archaeon]
MSGMIEPYSLKKEEEVKELWKKQRVPEKVRAKNASSSKNYYFMDGPPYATGHIHMGTALNKILKDVSIRVKRMQGFNVFDRPGYDTHGTPIEFQVEKEIGVKNKKDIEVYGIKKFIEKCRDYATRFIDAQNREFEDLGVWMDWKQPYITLSNDYIEAIWWTFKKAEEKGLLYLDKYSVHVCPRCETAVSYNEIEYTKLSDESIYVKFPARKEKNLFFIIWTTTPWTLPGNTGIMVHPEFEYSEVELSNGEKWVLAKELMPKIMETIGYGYRVIKEFKGKELEGMEYFNPLEKNLKLGKLKNAYRIVLSERYVDLESGTGLVHCAPGHGREDFEVGKEKGLPAISPVRLNGELTEETGKYAGKKARIVDKEIIEDLEKMNALVFRHPFTHDYPLCWRCKTPLLMISVPQWFFRISGIQARLIELNEKVNWVPFWMKDRMKNWLEGIGDWPISRARYWGTPLPIWVCDKCSERIVFGSVEELGRYAKLKKGLDLHKPEIDEIVFDCPKCRKGKMKRVPEVMDVWFDAGVSSWGALNYPKRKDLFERFWPADLNIEATEQVRGWWNSQIITSTICFDKVPFKAIAVHGMVLGLEKKKMSKSTGNTIQPKEVIEKYNRDYMRFYFCSVSKGEDIAFDWNSFNDINRFFNTLWNSFNFIKLYLKTDALNSNKIELKELRTEDKWIVSKFNSTAREAIEAFNKYYYTKAAALINEFLVEDFSRTYIKLIRDRAKEKAVSNTMNYVMVNFLKVLAPITPHITEYLYQNLKEKGLPESIHLFEFPEVKEELINKELEKEFELTKELAQSVLAMREEQKLRLRWPLKELIIESKEEALKETLGILASSVNVKKAVISKQKPKGNYASKEFNEKISLHLNLEADKELKEEWELAELVRRIQDKRKELKFNPNELIEMKFNCNDKKFIKKHKKEIEAETNTKITQGKGAMNKILEKEFFFELKK